MNCSVEGMHLRTAMGTCGRLRRALLIKALACCHRDGCVRGAPAAQPEGGSGAEAGAVGPPAHLDPGATAAEEPQNRADQSPMDAALAHIPAGYCMHRALGVLASA